MYKLQCLIIFEYENSLKLKMSNIIWLRRTKYYQKVKFSY